MLYDRLIENIDKWVDDIAEKIFMASGEAEQLDYNILRPELVNTDLTESIRQLLEKIEQLKAENAEPEGIPTLLGDISKDFLTKLALVRMPAVITATLIICKAVLIFANTTAVRTQNILR